MKNPIQERQALLVRGGCVAAATVRFADEAPLRLAVAGQVVTVLMATPGQERELAAGYALTMGWVRRDGDPPHVAFDAAAGRVDLDLALPPDQAEGVRTAGGGLLGPTEADPLPSGGMIDISVLAGLTEAMAAAQVLYRPTRGTHAAALFDVRGGLLALAEDVGRHNGLDKAVGAAWLAGRLSNAAALALSGRCSLEMVVKAVRAGVGVTVSVSAPTLPAVEAAQRLGLTLVNCARPAEMKVYTHPGRVSRQGLPLGLP
ncbi:MAG: formate dehydrogenase accessory sulfurtransferase FdhD [Pseudomonadota bacterium]